jgi:Zn-dependent protease
MIAWRPFTLMRVFGIRISVGISWFLVLFLYIFWFTPSFHQVLGGSETVAYLVTVASVLSFFLSVVLHELGHAFVARRNGLQVLGIELWMLGGLTRTSGEVTTPGPEFRVAAAGPAVTLLVIVVSLAASLLFTSPHDLTHVPAGTAVHESPVLVWLIWLGFLNLLVLVINLVPAVPLDGGQMAHAIVWRLTGDRNRATQVTGRFGQGAALLVAAAGLAILANGDSIGVCLLVMAVFVYQGAGAVVTQGSVGRRIAEVRVSDIMDREPVTISPTTTMLDAREQYFDRYHWPWFAVIDEDRHFLGVVTLPRVQNEIAAGRPALAVSEALEDEGQQLRIDENQPLEALLRSDGLRRLGGIVAVDADGVLRGVVTAAQLRQAMMSAAR